MRSARLVISADLLADLLSLPLGTRISDSTYQWGDVSLTVTHEGLRDVTLADGEPLPIVTPTFRSHPARSVEFDTWGQKP